jgi:hypothetical protein
VHCASTLKLSSRVPSLANLSIRGVAAPRRMPPSYASNSPYPKLSTRMKTKRLARMEVGGQFLYIAIESAPRRKQLLARRSAQAVPVAVHSADLQASPDELKAAILLFYGLLDEQQRRLFAGLESIRLGHGGDTLLGDFLGLDVHTVARGRQQLLDQNVLSGRSRRTGGGRTPAEKKRPT